MEQSSENKNYSASDIERYYNGQMPDVEMHALEKAALDDPFLADALEGYGLGRSYSQDLPELRERLRNRVQKKSTHRTIWWQAAAILIILAGGLWFLTSLDKSARPSVAREEEELRETVADSIENNPNAKTNDSFSTYSSGFTAGPLSSAPSAGRSAADSSSLQGATADRQYQFRYRKASTGSAKKEDVAATGKSGYVADTIVTGNSGADRSQPQWTFTAPAARSAMAKKKTDSVENMNVTMTELPNNNAEQVTFEKSSKEKSAYKQYYIISDTLEPAGGMYAYNEYVAGNLKVPEQLAKKPSGGVVKLSFEVDEKGNPVNITIAQSLCDACDAEAIRLLKNGPKWKKNNKKGTVSFRF